MISSLPSVVVIGGLISATLLTLIVLPSLYLAFARRGEPEKDDEEQAVTGLETCGLLPQLGDHLLTIVGQILTSHTEGPTRVRT